MMSSLNTWSLLVASLIVGAAGIAGWIDSNTMIMLVVMLIVCMPGGRAACRQGWRT